MNFIIEVIAEFFLTIFGCAANEVFGDREVPGFVKVLLIVLAAGFISGIFILCDVLNGEQ